MNREVFIKLYEGDKPMYEAWADFTLEVINSEIISQAGTAKEYSKWLKIKPEKRVKDTDSLIAKAFIRENKNYKDPYL